LNFATRPAKRLFKPASRVPEIPNGGMISMVRTKTKCIRRRGEGDEDRRARSLKRTLKTKDRRFRDIQRVQEIPRSLQLMQGSEESKCGIRDPIGQSSAISRRRRAGFPARSGAGPVMAACWGREAGELRDNQGHAFVSELLRNQPFRPVFG